MEEEEEMEEVKEVEAIDLDQEELDNSKGKSTPTPTPILCSLLKYIMVNVNIYLNYIICLFIFYVYSLLFMLCIFYFSSEDSFTTIGI